MAADLFRAVVRGLQRPRYTPRPEAGAGEIANRDLFEQLIRFRARSGLSQAETEAVSTLLVALVRIEGDAMAAALNDQQNGGNNA